MYQTLKAEQYRYKMNFDGKVRVQREVIEEEFRVLTRKEHHVRCKHKLSAVVDVPFRVQFIAETTIVKKIDKLLQHVSLERVVRALDPKLDTKRTVLA